MAQALTNSAQVWPTNSLGEIILTPGTGTTAVAGQLSSNFLPIDTTTGGVRVAGFQNVVVSSAVPVDADGQPSGTIYIQTV